MGGGEDFKMYIYVSTIDMIIRLVSGICMIISIIYWLHEINK